MPCTIKELHLSRDFGISDDTTGSDLVEGTDVIVYLEDNKTVKEYIATVFTYDEIQAQYKNNCKVGDFLNGEYFFKPNLLIVKYCSRESLEKIVNHLIKEGDFMSVFRKG